MYRRGYFDTLTFNNVSAKYFFIPYGHPRFSEIDSYRVLWNGSLMNYFEDAKTILISSLLKLKHSSFLEMGIVPSVTRYSVKLRRSIQEGENMVVALRPTQFKFGVFEFEELMLVDAEVRAQSYISNTFIDLKTKAMVYPMPDKMKEKINLLLDAFGGKVSAVESRKHMANVLRK